MYAHGTQKKFKGVHDIKIYLIYCRNNKTKTQTLMMAEYKKLEERVIPTEEEEAKFWDIDSECEPLPIKHVFCIKMAKPAAYMQPAYIILTDIPLEEGELFTTQYAGCLEENLR